MPGNGVAPGIRAEPSDEADTEEDAPTVHIYATCAVGQWALRWTNCEACGPIADGEATEPGAAYATATLALHPTREPTVVVADATITASAPPG